jgi:hypothetical protein
VAAPPAVGGAGAGVGSPGQPHVPTAAACAIAHCSSVYTGPFGLAGLPMNCANEHGTANPKNETSVAPGLPKEKSPNGASRQMLQKNTVCSDGDALGALVGTGVGTAVGVAVGVTVGTGVGHGVGRTVGLAVGCLVGEGVGSDVG